jgi:hypothetical protein
VIDAMTSAGVRLGQQTEPDDDEPGGPARPTPDFLPPETPELAPERDDDEPGGPAHPGPGHLPPASPETALSRLGF